MSQPAVAARASLPARWGLVARAGPALTGLGLGGRHGCPPKNRYGDSLFPVSVAGALAWARTAPGAVLVDAVPRYLPGWTRPLLRVPVAREFLTWNLLLVLRRAE